MSYCCVCGRKADHPTKSFHCVIDGDVYHYCRYHSFMGKTAFDRYCKTKKSPKQLEQLDYGELREEIHKILCDFLNHELLVYGDGEFDFEYLEFRTDEVLRLIKRQGGSITNSK